MMKDYNQNNVDLFLASLSKPDFKINMPKTRDVYIYMPARMSLIFSTVASFSFVDLETGEINKPLLLVQLIHLMLKMEKFILAMVLH